MEKKGTFTVKSGLAQMLKGGLIMDVTDAGQARIAEKAGAVAVMALERVPAIFGTCAGAIMPAKKIRGAEKCQGTLGLLNLEIDRNAYGTQAESFEETLRTELGTINAVFIRAPRIRSAGKGVAVLAERRGEPVACEQSLPGGRYLLATCFHPELTTTLFHARFLARLR